MSLATEQTNAIPTRTLAQVDAEFEQIGCLGHGGFGSVFLAKRKSGRLVALKFFNLDPDDEDPCESFTREVDAVTRLNTANDGGCEKDSRGLSIVFFEEWFIGSSCTGSRFACIVMNYADGGTLSQEIASKCEPYTERRIASYALQLCEALAYAHERGVAHHDVKSSNVLIDLRAGGRLLLADFGSAVAPGEAIVGFSEIYASPELIAAHARDDYTGLEAHKEDAYGLGCILYELLCCQKIVDLTGDQTLAEFIHDNGVDAALSLPCVRLPWLSAEHTVVSQEPGYSSELRSLIKTLLEPQATRWLPSDLQKPLREDPLSPLLAKVLVAAHSLVPGAPVTIDNVQLGMFVQRGQDWNDGDSDGGEGSFGVIVKLDPDALYTTVVWPPRKASVSAELECYRIGAGQKFELQVAPTPITNFYNATDEPMTTGLLQDRDVSNTVVGQHVNSNCVVVGVDHNQSLFFVAPLERKSIPSRVVTAISPQTIPAVLPRKAQAIPETWQSDKGMLVEVSLQEKCEVLDLFHSIEGGMDIQHYEVTSIKRVKCTELWNAYARAREDVAAEFWGVPNEKRLFHGTWNNSPEFLLRNWSEFYQKCSSGDQLDVCSQEILFSNRASWADENRYQVAGGEWQVVLSRVSLGRVRDERKINHVDPEPHELSYHSKRKLHSGPFNEFDLFAIHNASQAVPEYVVTYKPLYLEGRRIVSARWPSGMSPQRAREKRHSPSLRSTEGVGNVASSGRANGARLQTQDQVMSGQVVSSLVAATVAFSVESAPEQSSEDSTQDKIKVCRTSPTKMCVVCLRKPVCRILLPCGHPCLCEVCSTEQALSKLRRQCPECRSTIREAATIYGRVVND